jgi:hypothetical protein
MNHWMPGIARSAVLATLLVSFAVFISLLGPGAALAENPAKGYAPPGNSGVSQYMEDIPTASGGKPSSSVVIPPGGGSGGSGRSGGSGGAPSSSVPSSVSQKLDSDGSSGKQADALAKTTGELSGSGHVHQVVRAAAAPPSRQVLSALDGSTGGGGLGVLLPVILIGSLVIASVAGLLRRRRSV